MKVLFAASECVPFVKTGGLADVVGALSPVLKAQGADVRVILPLYAAIPETYVRQMKLECDALRAVAPNERRGGSGVSEIDAEGNIKMLYENKDIRAGGAKILPSESAALLSGSPHIKDIPSRAEISGGHIPDQIVQRDLEQRSDQLDQQRCSHQNGSSL